LFVSPAEPNPCGKPPARYAELFCGIGDIHLPPWGIYDYTASPINNLLLCSCPSAIIRFVISIVIDTIYTRPIEKGGFHISQKISERIPPSANCNAAAAVMRELLFVFAAFVHITPSAPKRVAPRQASLRVTNAATRSGVSDKVAAINDGFFTAVAETNPASASVRTSFFRKRCYNKLTELLAYQISERRHKAPYSETTLCARGLQ